MTSPLSPLSIAQKLRLATHQPHEALDQRIMASAPFSSRERYTQFLQAQHHFHLDIDPLFGNASLRTFVPDLTARRRLDEIQQDLDDLGVRTEPGDLQGDLPPVAPPGAWGWLYVAEGSKLGAAILLKHAEKLGLSDTFGARHLAAHYDGRARHWRSFTEALDRLPWTEVEEAAMADAARQAFARMLGYVEQSMPLSAGLKVG